MDVLEILKADHDKVKRLFNQFEETDNEKHRLALFRTIRNELTTHTFVEETVFYPAFRRYDEFKSWLDQAQAEHGQMKTFLKEMGAMSSIGSEEFAEKFESLKEEVEHHVSDEENDFFPKVRKLMKRPEREALGRHVEAARQEKAEAA